MIALLLAATLSFTSPAGAVPSSGTIELQAHISGPITTPLRLHFSPYVDRVEATIPLRDGSTLHALAGTSIPFNQRPIKLLDPMIALPANMAVPATIALRVHAEDLRFAQPTLETNFPPNPPAAPVLFYVLTIGLLLGIALYHVMLYGALRERDIFLYVIYLTTFIFFELTSSGLAWQYLWPFAAFPAIAALRIAAAVLALGVMVFARSFMRTRQTAPTADAIFVGFVGFVLLATLLGLIFPNAAAVLAIVADIGLLFGIVACTVLAIICARRGVREAIFFLIGFTGLFIGGIIKIVVDDLGSITSTAHFYGVEIGVSFDAVVIALGLADRMRREIREREQAQALAAEHERVSLTDALCGVPNRRAFDDRLHTEWNRCARNTQSIAIAMFDVDRFKPFNDLAGHMAGDECLKLVAQTAQSMLRRADEFFARYGGEEFAVILPGRTLAEAQVAARRVTRAIRELAIAHPQGDYVTMSAGVYACIGGAHTDPELLLSGADAALYRAKESGGDRVAV